jgi:hypothetical protein
MDFNDLDNVEYEIVDDSKVEALLSALNITGFSNEVKKFLQLELETFDITPERYSELALLIYNNQLDRINAGLNYNMTDITKKINREIL